MQDGLFSWLEICSLVQTFEDDEKYDIEEICALLDPTTEEGL